jgi:membrane glycosyltransferase
MDGVRMDGATMDGMAMDRAAWAASTSETLPPALPPESPLAMPVQSLRARAARDPALPPSRRPVTEPRGIALRRLFVIGGAIAMTAEGVREMYLVLGDGGLTALQLLILVLFASLFAWIALSFTSALCGFVSVLARGGLGLGITRDGPLPPLAAPTALLMPTYNEDPARVMAAIAAMHAGLGAAGRLGQFDFFILSDTTAPDKWIAEEAAYLALRDTTDPARIHDGGTRGNIFYRRRAKNTHRKAGNIADWVTRWGGAYPQMLILDADSVMTAAAVIRLAAALEQNPTVGLIQTLPVIVNGVTLFARMQQFAGRLYGPLIAHGIAAWHGAEGNYWGHNAMIRTRAFAAQAGLPELPGRKPFGGHVMSHDFVEAALMRRGGWAIHMVPALEGSYEESPPSLPDLAIRDRRWCQGNLQHAAILPARGLNWISRLHLLMGIGSYITAPLWLCFLLVGICISLQSRFVPPEYFSNTRTLFPLWPHIDPVRSKFVFAGTMAVLLAPKLLSWITLLFDGPLRRGCGGMIRALISMLIETLLAGLLAPVTMLVQSGAVAGILAGMDSGWNTQRRDDGGIPVGAIIRRYWRCTAFGALLGIGAWLVSTPLALWMSPVVGGLLLAVPLALLTGTRAAGIVLRRLGLLLIPEERAPPRELADAGTLFRTFAARRPPGVADMLGDPRLREAHRAMLPPPRRPRVDPLDPVLLVGLAKLSEAETLAGAMASLSSAETAAVLADGGGLSRLAELADPAMADGVMV